ncbi:MAG: hypothetical protein HOE90_13030 [Bacteriovoracaceae bacterium]|jgi:hypothetical protein|nr:hypothetical protein [Bacteriovoracaceae bacterium]
MNYFFMELESELLEILGTISMEEIIKNQELVKRGELILVAILGGVH